MDRGDQKGFFDWLNNYSGKLLMKRSSWLNILRIKLIQIKLNLTDTL